ncbi:hypothetical protein P9112_005404 [Eukaryota sp. TZLM1-RC]
MPPSSVEASALPEATLPEGSTPKEDNSLPEDSVPMEGSSPPQDSVPVEGGNPPKDSVPSEGRSPSLVSYDDEDVEDSVAPLPPSQLRASEVPPSPLPERSFEVPSSPFTQSRKTVQPSLTAKEGLEDQPSSPSKKAIEVPSSSLPSSSEVPPSHSQQLHPPVPTVRRTIQNAAVPTSGSPLTTLTVSGVNNLSVSPPQARDSTPSIPNFPSHLSEEQRKRYELLFSDLVDYEEPPREFSHIAQPPVPPTEHVPEIDRETGEVSKKYLERYFHEDRIWKLKNRLDRELQARRGTSSTLAHHQPLHSVSAPLYSSSYASNSVREDSASRQHRPNIPHRDSRVNPNDPEAIPPTEMSKGHPPFFGGCFSTLLLKVLNPRTLEPGVRYMKTTREGVFRRFAGDDDILFINEANPCPYPRFSPGYNASLDILIDRDHRTGWWFTETTYQERLFLYDRRPDHIASFCGPDHRRTGNLPRALQQVTVFPGCVESRILKWVMVEGRIEKTRLVQPAVSFHQVPAQFEDVQESPQPQHSEAPSSSAQPPESPQPPMETDSLPTTETSNPNQYAMEQADDDVVTVSSESPTPITSSDAVPAPITPISRAPQPQPTPSTTGSTSSISSHHSPFSGTYESSLLLFSMMGSRDRDDRRRDCPKRPYLEASDLRDADKLLKFVNKFILWSRTDRVLRETRSNEVARLREELEQAREGSQPSIDEYFGNITGEPAISSPTVPTSRDERIIWAQIPRRTQFSRLDKANRALLATNMDWSERDYGNRWIDFMVNIGRVLTRSTAIQEFRGISQQLRTFSISSTPLADRLSDWVVATHVLESVGIIPIRDRLLRIWSSPSDYLSDGHTLGEFFSVLQIEHENFCNARSFMEQLNHVDFTYQNQLTHQQASRRPPTVVPSPPDIPRPRGSGPGKRPKQSKRGGSLPQSSSQAADVQCNFCKQKGHPTERCPSEDCQRSKKWREQQAQQQARGRSSRGSGFRSRRGTRGRGRGSFYNKRSRHYFCTLETIPPTTTTQPHTESSAWKDFLINPLANLEPTKIPNSQANFFSEQADLNGHDSDTIFMVQSMNHNCLQLNFLINNVEVKGIIDSGATCSVVTEDVISNCNMARSNETISYKIADGTTSQSLGTASGTLSIRLGSVTQIVHVKHKFSIVPGHETILIGADLLSHLGLMNNKGIYIRMDDACRTLLLPEAEFDHRISQASEVVNVSTRWLEHINSSGCTINLDNDHFKKSLLQTLKEFEDVFTLKPHAEGIDCPPMEINFYNEDVRVRRPPRTLNPARLEVANQIFDELVDSGFAVPSNHEFSSPPRLTGDYSGKDGVNANTIPVEPNLPRISDVLVFLSQANYIGTLDLPKAFWQLKIAEKDWQKTALSIPGKSIMFKRAAFGLKNVPAVFQNVMADIFSGDGVFIYIDDIIIIGSTFDEFIERLRRVLDQARCKRVFLGLPKCHCVSSRHPIKILGSVFQNKQRTIDPTRVESLLNLPRPKTIKDVRSLVGSVNFIREWLPQVSELIAPIIRLTKKDGNNSNVKPKPRAQRLQWTDMHDGLLQKIKQLIAKHMPLSLPPLEKQILISCDASDIAVGGVIWEQIEQVDDPGTPLINRKCRPISFFSRLLTNSQKNWPTNQKKLYAILLMLTQSGFENYLKGRKLVIFTDHQNLTYMFTAPEKNRIVTRWLPIFSEFCFDLVHTEGEDNFWADMLSRIVPPIDHQEINHLSHQMPPNFHPIFYIDKIDGTENERYYIEDLNNFERIMVIRERCSNDLPIFEPWLCRIRSEQKLAIASKDPSFNSCVHNNHLDLYMTQDNKIVIPKSLIKDTLNLLHGLLQGGHPSKAESLNKLRNSDYWWPNMLTDMNKHVQECPSCQKTKPVPKLHVPPTGSLWADRPFARVNADIIGPLPEDQEGYKYSLVFIDSFSRFTIIVPLKEINANLTADALIWKVCAIFGIPFQIHSDNGPEFSKAVFDELSKFLGIEVSKSIPRFSLSNGLVERRHRDILQNLRKLLVDFNANDVWSEYLPYVQLLINSSKSSITNHTPYQVIFGSDVSPRSDPGKILEIIESSTSESSFIQEIQSKFRRLKEKQEKVAHHQASKASKLTRSSTPNPFEVGQLVLRASGSSAKLHGDYLGPFLITEIVSNSLPTNDEFHSWVAAGDVEEHIIEKVLSQEGDFCQVQWPGKEITTERVSTVQNTAAYKDFIKTLKARRRTKSAPPKKRNNSISSPPVTRASRARRSKERKRQC